MNNNNRSDEELIPLDDPDKVIARVKEHFRDQRETFNQLHRFVVECSKKGKDVTAYAYAEKMLLYAEDAREKAFSLLCMGQLKERAGDYEEALNRYLSAMDLPQEQNDAWYFLNNNLGYCLNWFGRYAEAAPYCLAAIRINPNRHNAFKNLGVALQGQGAYSKAAAAYIEAIRICPRDGRALNHLEDLISNERERLACTGDIMLELKRCRDLVERAAIQ